MNRSEHASILRTDAAVTVRAQPRPTFDAIHRIATWAVGKEIEPYIPLLAEEMVVGEDPRRPEWSKDEVAPDRPFLLGGTYALILLGWPILALSMLGLADSALDIRGRVARKRGLPTPRT